MMWLDFLWFYTMMRWWWELQVSLSLQFSTSCAASQDRKKTKQELRLSHGKSSYPSCRKSPFSRSTFVLIRFNQQKIGLHWVSFFSSCRSRANLPSPLLLRTRTLSSLVCSLRWEPITTVKLTNKRKSSSRSSHRGSKGQAAGGGV